MVTATREELIPEAFREIVLLRPLTAEDLKAFPHDGNRYEIIGGQLIVSPSPNSRHQRVSFELSGALYVFLKQTGLGQGFSAPADVHISSTDVVQPDVFVVLRERDDIIQVRGIFGAPDLVVEILSPSSMETDFLRKSRLYEQYGVREYWIVDPEREIVSVQTLDGDRFVITGEYGRNDHMQSTVLDGFELELSAIFPVIESESEQPAIKDNLPTNDD